MLFAHLLFITVFALPFALLLRRVRRLRAAWMDLYGYYDRLLARKAAWIFTKHACRHNRPRRWMRRNGFGNLLHYLG